MLLKIRSDAKSNNRTNKKETNNSVHYFFILHLNKNIKLRKPYNKMQKSLQCFHYIYNDNNNNNNNNTNNNDNNNDDNDNNNYNTNNNNDDDNNNNDNNDDCNNNDNNNNGNNEN